MDSLEERYCKTLIKHLEDISKSLKIISGRLSLNDDLKNHEKKPAGYVESYFKRSMAGDYSHMDD